MESAVKGKTVALVTGASSGIAMNMLDNWPKEDIICY